jgi:hypothetical protein
LNKASCWRWFPVGRLNRGDKDFLGSYYDILA